MTTQLTGLYQQCATSTKHTCIIERQLAVYVVSIILSLCTSRGQASECTSQELKRFTPEISKLTDDPLTTDPQAH